MYAEQTSGEGSGPDAAGTAEPLIAFFIPDLTVGGAEQVTVNIVNGLAARGYAVELLLSRNEGKLRTELDDEVTVVTLQPDRTSVLGVGAHLPALVSYLRRREPALFLPHLRHPSVVSLTINRLFETETKIIPTHHAAFGQSTEQTVKDRVVESVVPRLYPAADGLIAVSDGVAEGLAARTPVDRKDISVLHNPVDVAEIQRRARQPVDHPWLEDDDRDVVVFVGRHTEQKALDTWVRTFQRVYEENPDARGIIAGTGPQSEEIADAIEAAGLSEAVTMPGYVENPYGLMSRADVFLLSSRYEGLPTVLIEALACGCPVVATDCESGPREILDNGKFGVLAPVGDERALATGVTELLDAPPATDLLRARAAEFAPDAVLDAYEQFIEEQIDRQE
ncbi:glycosyltransferase [Halovenus sp. WSH3]|uniref:Glycosyltransferase n=1 Tax=Halovenus carboxidivorans TaxID=2692199 RepID=A0A6B0T3Y7_9EURY|nr:glycosyltransferase [Halovenus carboxidivorans]